MVRPRRHERKGSSSPKRISAAGTLEAVTIGVSLRPAVPEDRAFLFGLHRASMGPQIEERYGPWNDAVQWEFFDRWFRPEHTSVIRVGGDDVGVLAFKERDDDVYVTRIGIRPDRQGQGIGTTVLRRLLEQAHEAGKAVSLHVFEINPAREPYRSLGFTTSSERDGRILMRATPLLGCTGCARGTVPNR